MTQPQHRTRTICVLQVLNVIVGVLNAVVSIGLIYILVILSVALTPYGHKWLYPFGVLFLILLFLFLAKLCFDVVFIYSVLKERLVTVKMYCYSSVVLLVFLTLIAQFIESTGVLVFFYSLNISTIFLSYFYDQRFISADDV